jgi:hypothetical protein
MKTLKYVYFCFIVLFISCNPENNFLKIDQLPVLIHQEPLPPIPHDLKKKTFKLNTRMLISEKGEVIDVEILSTDENRTWDSLAIEKLKQWVFTPAILQNVPIRVKIKQPIKISVKDPLFLNLIEIVFDNAEIAYRIYDSLNIGNNFSEMVETYSISESKHNHGKIGTVNIRELEFEIQKYFEPLDYNEYTKPFIYKGKYTIFKRIKDEN